MNKSFYAAIFALVCATAVAAVTVPQRKRLAPPKALSATRHFDADQTLQPIVAKVGDGFMAKSPRLNVAANDATVSVFTLDPAVELRGKIVYANNWTASDSPKGVYKVPTDDNGKFSLLGLTQGGAYASYDDGAGHYYDLNESGWGVWLSLVGRVYDTETWTVITPNPTGIKKSAKAIDVDYDPVTGTVYGAFVSESGGTVWGSIDYSTWEMSAVAPIAATVSGVACSSDGRYYIYDGANGTLYSINKLTADMTPVGTPGLLTPYQSSACFEPISGKMLQVIKTDELTSALYALDLTDGSAAKVCQFADGEQILGLHIPRKSAPAGAPDTPLFSASAPNGEMTIEYSMTLPDKRFDGTPLEGELTYKVRLDGVEAVTGTAVCGSVVTGSVAVDGNPGMHIVSGVCENEAGSSPLNTVYVYVGKANPMAVSQMTARYENGKMKFEWTPVTESSEEGYFNPDQVTYSIWLGDEMIARDLDGTSYEYALQEPDSYTVYYYSIKAHFGDKSSALTPANVVALGAFDTPYIETFDKDVDMSLFTIFNMVDGTQTWGSNGAGHVTINSDKAYPKDDWLILPALNLEEGKYYRFTMLAWPNQRQSETFDVKFGSAPTPEAMTGTIISDVDVKECNVSNKYRIEAYFTPEQTGRTFIGLHATTPADAWILLCDEIEVSAPLAGFLPSEPTDMTVIPDADFRLSATVSATAPSVGMDGAPLLENIQKIVLMRGEEEAGIVTDIEPGTQFSITDNAVPQNGEYTYSLFCYSHDMPGRPSTASAYIGLAAPLPPTDVIITETANPGQVTVSWTAPTQDILGRSLKENNLSYMLFTYNEGRYEYVPQLDSNVAGNSVTLQACDADTQKFVYYIVDSYNGDLKSKKHSISQLVAVGRDYEAPFSHSFSAPDFKKYILGLSSHGEGSWNVYQADELGIPSQDGDGMIAAMLCQWVDQPSEDIFTGKIHIPADMKNPVASIWTFNMSGMKASEFDYPAEVLNTLAISVLYEGDTIQLEKKEMRELGSIPGWYKMYASLDAYKGKTVQLVLTAKSVNMAYTFVDNWALESQFDNDMEALDISAPSRVRPLEKFPVQVTMRNAGASDATPYKVILLRDGKEFAALDMPALPAGKTTVANFEISMFEADGLDAQWQARIEADGDMNLSNNMTPVVTTRLELSYYPTVDDLSARQTDKGIELNWSAPDMSNAIPDGVTEDFENATPWSQSVDGWTILDLDNRPVGGVMGMVLPNGIGGTDEVRTGFFVWDNNDQVTWYEGVENPTWMSHSGSRHLSSMFLIDGTNCNDDLAISPELYGGPQTISLYASSYDPIYIDYMSVYYSDSNTTNPSKFALLPESGVWVACGRDENGKSNFFRYEFELPDGAKRFAIRAGGVDGYVDGFMLMVDDVTFAPAGGKSSLELTGYNVYRDGVRLNSELLKAPGLIDKDEQLPSEPTYAVTAVYNIGESRLSNIVGVSISGVDQICDDAQGVEYFDMWGRKIETEDLTPGIYVRRTVYGSEKIMIK